MFSRSLFHLLVDPELSDKMIFLAGPRQVGKTSLAQEWLKKTSASQGLYYNWDDEKVRVLFRKDPHFFESQARALGKQTHLVFDEIHKVSRWKNILKGYFDVFKNDFHFLITGSARLEMFQKSGDSLLGRYHLLHLGPLVPHELLFKKVLPKTKSFSFSSFEEKPLPQDAITTLLHYSGFPEMMVKQSVRALNLWHQEYQQRLLREDLRDLSRISDMVRAEHLFTLLPQKVGSPLSINSLREDLNCSHDSMRMMIQAFHKIYLLTSIRPYSRKIKNSLIKEPKIYLYDWSRVSEEGPRFENMMAIMLKTYCEMMTDGGWGEYDLCYVRNKQKHEIDFLITRQHQPLLLIECKLSDFSNESISPLVNQLGIPFVGVTLEEGVYKKLAPDRWMVSANRFFNLLWQGEKI